MTSNIPAQASKTAEATPTTPQEALDAYRQWSNKAMVVLINQWPQTPEIQDLLKQRPTL